MTQIYREIILPTVYNSQILLPCRPPDRNSINSRNPRFHCETCMEYSNNLCILALYVQKATVRVWNDSVKDRGRENLSGFWSPPGKRRAMWASSSLEPPGETPKPPRKGSHPPLRLLQTTPPGLLGRIGRQTPRGTRTRVLFVQSFGEGADSFLQLHQNQFIGKTNTTSTLCMSKTEGKGVGGYMIEVVCFELKKFRTSH